MVNSSSWLVYKPSARLCRRPLLRERLNDCSCSVVNLRPCRPNGVRRTICDRPVEVCVVKVDATPFARLRFLASFARPRTTLRKNLKMGNVPNICRDERVS